MVIMGNGTYVSFMAYNQDKLVEIGGQSAPGHSKVDPNKSIESFLHYDRTVTQGKNQYGVLNLTNLSDASEYGKKLKKDHIFDIIWKINSSDNMIQKDIVDKKIIYLNDSNDPKWGKVLNFNGEFGDKGVKTFVKFSIAKDKGYRIIKSSTKLSLDSNSSVTDFQVDEMTQVEGFWVPSKYTFNSGPLTLQYSLSNIKLGGLNEEQ